MVIDVSASGHYVGDCRELLARLPERCVQTCITSPPYWGLRDYGTAKWDGGDAACDHRESKPSRTAASVASSTLGGGKSTVHASHVFNGDCGRCGAIRVDRQLGLESTPELYVAAIVEVFRGVRRALRDDGTLWVNLGDSYAGSRSGPQGSSGEMADREVAKHRGMIGMTKAKGGDPKNPRKGPGWNDAPNRQAITGLKYKDLVGIPWLVAFALRADGWYLRSDIIWHKPNPMPESVRDRPTKAHEYLFLLSKSETYHYDSKAAAERTTWRGQKRNKVGPIATTMPGAPAHVGLRALDAKPPETRNLRSVWTVATQPYAGAHFATFPPRLIEPCVLAGSRPGDIVLDPFFGSGTTGMVAQQHGRRYIGFDLGYADLAEERLRTPMLPMRGVS